MGGRCGPPQQADGPGPRQEFRVAWPVVTGGEEDPRKRRTGVKTKKGRKTKYAKSQERRVSRKRGHVRASEFYEQTKHSQNPPWRRKNPQC